MNKKKVIILGAGFGGIYTYLSLKKHLGSLEDVDVTIVDQKNYFLFVPMIHEVATGNLEPSSVIQPIRQAIDTNKVTFIEGTIHLVDLDNQKVTVKVCTETKDLEYDYLVFAMGSETNFFGIPGAEYTHTLKDLEDAMKLRNKIITAFEHANILEDIETRKELLTFVVVGGGPTGVELAGELADFLNHEIKKAYPDLCGLCSIHLIQSADRLMPPVDIWFHERSKRILEKIGVILYFQRQVTEVTKEQVILDNGSKIASKNIFWTAGVTARLVELAGQKVKSIIRDERSQRLQVQSTLQLDGFDNLFAVGDQMFLKSESTGQPYPMRAQFAAREGEIVGKNIATLLKGKATLSDFSGTDQGFIVSLGKGGALAQVMGFKISGPFAWWMYRTAYLLKLVGTRAKLKTAYDWTINLFLPRDISRF